MYQARYTCTALHLCIWRELVPAMSQTITTPSAIYPGRALAPAISQAITTPSLHNMTSGGPYHQNVARPPGCQTCGGPYHGPGHHHAHIIRFQPQDGPCHDQSHHMALVVYQPRVSASVRVMLVSTPGCASEPGSPGAHYVAHPPGSASFNFMIPLVTSSPRWSCVTSEAGSNFKILAIHALLRT